MENYETVQAIGRGAYGNVYLYRRLSDNKQVVIKQIPLESISNDECQMTKNEVRVLAMLQHPNIIEYYDNMVDHNTMMIVMEYAPGGNLYDYLRSRDPSSLLQEEEVLQLFCQLVLGIQHIHERNILHRDLKSHNILLDRSHRLVKIGDFGISKILSSKSKAHTVVGTPCYLSPELCQEKPYNQKSDIWALGCILYEMLTLKRAFEAETLPALIMKIMRGIFAPIHPHYSADMRAVVHLLLHMDPTQRPDIHQVISHHLIFPTLFRLHVDLGMIPCVSRPLRLSSVAARNRSARGSEDSTDKGFLDKKTGSRESVSVVPERNISLQDDKKSMLINLYKNNGTSVQPIRLILGDSNLTQLSVSNTHIVGVTTNGQVIQWKEEKDKTEPDEKQLKAQTPEDQVRIEGITALSPRTLDPSSSAVVVQVSCGEGFIACLTNRGILLTSGDGSGGCLGHGDVQSISKLRIVEALLGVSVSHVACGTSHVIAASEDSKVFTWGTGESGRLGIGSRSQCTSPQQVELGVFVGTVHELAAGPDCSLILLESGALLVCGSNRYNKLCIDETDCAGAETLKQVEGVARFVHICTPPLDQLHCVCIAVGNDSTYFVTDGGQVFSVGENSRGQLGHTNALTRMPGQVMGPVAQTYVERVVCGEDFAAAIDIDGKVYVWGSFRSSLPSDLAASHTENHTPELLDYDSRHQECQGATALGSNSTSRQWVLAAAGGQRMLLGYMVMD